VVPWPWWCQLIAILLILSSVLWIPSVAIVKYFRFIEWKEEVPAYFPEEELSEERQFKPHVSNRLEKVLFGFK
jgi:solute carrier family 6 amino acid/orphan transporter-like 15/16/17/18/20